MKVEDYPEYIAITLRERGWVDEEDLDPEQAFDEFCEFEGLIHWGKNLRKLYEDCGIGRLVAH